MLVAIFTAILTLASAPSDTAVRDTTKELLGDRGIQKKLPGADKAGGKSTAAQKRRQRRRAQRDRRPKSEPRFGSSLGRGAMYMAMAIVFAVVLFWILRGSMGYEPDRVVEAEEDDKADVDRGVVDRPLEDAEALASSGEFADAVHTLLLKTLMELAMRRGQPLASSLTSREILARVGLPDLARQALGEIVDVVEISHFGNLAIGADEYERCLASYSRFSSAFLGAR